MTELAVADSRAVRPAGWWGMALFVATEATLFGTIVGTYVYLRSQAVRWPPAGIEPPKVLWPLVLTLLLVLTSVPLQAAVSAAHTGRVAHARRLIALAVAVQAGYLAAQLVLYTHDLSRFTPAGSAYGSIYFTMLGAHDAHVAAGILLELWVLLRLLRGLTRYRLVALRATTLYWHFVNVAALVVVAVQLGGPR